ncbi:MAG: DUF2125 domain-containing protein [Devosia sp.]
MRRFVILIVVVVVVIAGWSGAWLWAAGQIGSVQRQLATADGIATPRVTCQSFAVGGFPFGFDLTCSGATVTSGDVTVTAAGLKASVEVYNPTHVLAFAEAPVGVSDAFTGSQSRLDFASATASARLTGWRIARISVVLEQPAWNDTVLDDRLIAKASHVEAHLVDAPEKHDGAKGLAALDAFAQLDGLDAPAYGIANGKGTLDAEIANLPDDVRTYGDADLPKRWQAAGGTLTLSGFKGEDGARNFTVTGNASLDSTGRPQGQVRMVSTGVVEALGTTIPEQLKGVLIGAQAADGSYSQTLNIAGGMVFAGLVPVAMLEPLF